MDKVISFGEALVDMLSTKINDQSLEAQAPEAFIKFPGGAPANVAAAIGKLGGRSYFAGKIGKDMFGDFICDALVDAHVNIDYLHKTTEGKTALAFVSLDAEGERSFEFYRDRSADLLFQSEDFESGWFSESGIFHFCSNTLTSKDIQKTTLAGIQYARGAGSVISFDVNVRHNLWPNGQALLAPIWQCIEQADVIKVSVEELDFIRDNQSESACIENMFEMGVSLILVTDGGNPLRYYTPEYQGQIAPPEINMVDSTAAGDGFIGGFLYQLAEQDASKQGITKVIEETAGLERMLTFASHCGAHAAMHKLSLIHI